jgi:TDG/mug DNA glycosylase family protein
MRELPDILQPQARILFVGINPGLRSAEIGHHFAGRGNPFYRLLHAAGLTPVLLTPEEDVRLPEFGLSLTNLCRRPSRAASELSRAELSEGARELAAKIAALRPRVVAFVGLSIYQHFFDLPGSGGAGPKPQTIAGARVFVLPNPSGLNQSFPGFAHKLVWFVQLAAFADQPSAERLPTPGGD